MPATNDSSQLSSGRRLFRERAWRDAHEALTAADATAPLAVEDLWLLASASNLCGREDAARAALERIYKHRADTEPNEAARAAFWIGFRLMHLGEVSRAQGWIARTERCLERIATPSVVSGYLELPRVRALLGAGKLAEALEAAERAGQVAARFGDADLAAFACNLRGRIRIRLGELATGLKLLDEAMLAALGDELSPLITGLVYCAAIDSCQAVFELGRARSWTSALKMWCDAQPQLSTFTGACLVCRSEILEVSGDWASALGEAQLAAKVYTESLGESAAGQALYRQAEIHRLRGELAEAEARYVEASDRGWDPQPGLSLLRLAQGRADAAIQGLRRALAVAPSTPARAKLLVALVDVAVESAAVAEARAASVELSGIAETFGTEMLGALAQKAQGTVMLAEGNPSAAASALRNAFESFRRLDAPHHAARARFVLGCAYQALGDEEGALLEAQAARQCFQKLGAATDLRALQELLSRARGPANGCGLTPRELEVLRLVASGKTNKLIAQHLQLSEKTVDRHVSNILTKLDLPSRSAATAYAYEKKLI